MKGINKVILVCTLGKDPELKYFASGDALCNVSAATSESWVDKTSGDKKEATEWHNLVFRKKLAEIAAQYLKKGSKVYIEGSLKTRKWTKDGVDRFTTEIIVQDMQMLDGKPQEQKAQSTPSRSTGRPAAREPSGGGFNDDIPFAPRHWKEG